MVTPSLPVIWTTLSLDEPVELRQWIYNGSCGVNAAVGLNTRPIGP